MKWIKKSLIDNKKISLNDVLIRESSKYNLLSQFKSTEQDPDWHSEGNVFIHTQMVIDETYIIFKENELDISKKYILLMAAIFHDIAKPITTKHRILSGVNRVVATKHEVYGMSYLFYRFLGDNIDLKEMESILELIGYHQQPKLLSAKSKSKWHYKFLTRKVSGEMFYFHQIADMKGRTCFNKDKQLNYLHQFKVSCQDYDCFKKISAIKKDIHDILSKKHAFKNESELSYISSKVITDLINDECLDPLVSYDKHCNHKESHSNVYILCGLSGSGKSTIANSLIKKEKINLVICLDEIRKKWTINDKNRRSIDGMVIQKAKKLLKDAMAKKENIIWDSCNLKSDSRSEIIKLVNEYHGKSILLFIKTPVKECITNDIKRKNSLINTDIISEQIETFQYPEDKEFNEIYNFDSHQPNINIIK